MSKKSKIILAAIMGILFVLSVAFLFFPRHNYDTNVSKVIEVKNGVASPSSFQGIVYINKKSQYRIKSDWSENNAPAFISGLSVTDSLGNEVFCVTGDLTKAWSIETKLSKGTYTFTVDILTSPESFESYLKLHGLDNEGTVNPVDADFYKDGSALMKYDFSIEESGRAFTLAMLIAGIIIGGLLVVIIVNVAIKENTSSPKYDERQLIYQGKAHKYAFFTMLIYMILLLTLYAAGDIAGTEKLPVDNATLVLVGILISALVFAIYAILKDAYFRLDENRNFLFGFFIVLTVIDMLIGVFHILNGDIATDGVITFIGSGNLLAGIAMLIFIIVIAIKRIQEKNSEEND